MITNLQNKQKISNELDQKKFFSSLFLPMSEILVLNKIFSEFNCYYYNTFDFLEYSRVVISYEKIVPDFKVVILKIESNKFFKIEHYQVLGAILNLGIRREHIGDIIISDCAYVFCSTTSSKIILEQLEFVGKAKIKISICQDVIFNSDVFESSVTIASSRIDLLIAKVFKLSRNEVKSFFQERYIKVNYIEEMNFSKKFNLNDLISVRTKGRIKVISINEHFKKEKMVIRYQLKSR